MDKKCGILIVSVTILVLCFVGTVSATNWTVDGSGGADFTGIQNAIDNASVGDTIIVHSGVYHENVVVNKSVTLKGVNLPVVDAGGDGSAITLTADGITLVGFTTTNSGSLWNDAGIAVISNNNTITGSNASNNSYNGIYLSGSNNIITGNNACKNNGDGISLSYSSNSTINGNTFVNDGLSVRYSCQNTVEDNTVNGKPLVYLEDVLNYKVEDAGQIILVNCSNITVENLDLSNTSVGIDLWDTEDSTISNNTVCNNSGRGIRLHSSSNNNTITGNNVSNNRGGISLSSSRNNTITGNNVSNNRSGIHLSSSSNNTIAGNVFVNDGLSVYLSYQNTVEDNTVNGKPLVYLEDVSDYKVEDAGQVILVNCTNITVEDLDLSNTHVGIELWETEDSIISNNTLCNNDDGVKLWNSGNNTIKGNNVSNNNGYGIFLYFSSSNNTIKGNNVSNNEKGIHLHYSSNNIVTGNNVSSNNDVGIYLSSSSNNNSITGNNVGNNNEQGILLYTSSNNNSITGNNVNNNVDGIHLWVSSNNTIYFNNFINNTNNVDSYKSTNIWNSPLDITYTYDGATYVSYLGNYWDDYEERYPDAEKIDSTGIWDTPYRIDEEEDNYPLMKPFENYNIIPTSAHT